MRISSNILQLIGNTPLVRLNSVSEEINTDIYAKLEFCNPGGSIKDRVALYIIEDAERRGILKPGDTIVEATSGNMGIGFALVGAVKGYSCIFTLPESISKEKIQVLKLYGAEVVLTPKGLPPADERSCYKVAQRIANERGGFYVNQYFNLLNPETHYKTTGPEIWQDTCGSVDAVFCGMGTGGTITGVGRYIKEKRSSVRIIGVEPISSIFRKYLSEGKLDKPFDAAKDVAASFDIEGIGKNFIPGVVDFSCIDDVVQVDDKEAFLMVDKLIQKEGIFAGGSGGAVLTGALKYAKSNKFEHIVIILPDTGLRYLSSIVTHRV